MLRFDTRQPRMWYHKYQHIYMVRPLRGYVVCHVECLLVRRIQWI
jgi:hypothetical protein